MDVLISRMCLNWFALSLGIAVTPRNKILKGYCMFVAERLKEGFNRKAFRLASLCVVFLIKEEHGYKMGVTYMLILRIEMDVWIHS